MGLLNHLFGSKKDIAKELIIDDNKRMALWDEHLSNFLLREKLFKNFNFRNIDKALQDWKTTDKLLGQIESLISPELVSIINEKKTNEEILYDLKKLKSIHEIEKLSDMIVSVKQKQFALLKLFYEILNVLKTELHLIGLIRRNPPNARDLLLQLFELMFHREARLYQVFREEYYYKENEYIHANIIKISRAIILEKEIKEEMETDEEKFAREIVRGMIPSESKRRYRELGEDIFLELAEMAGAPLPSGEEISGIRQMEAFMRDNKIMYKIIKKLRPRWGDIKINATILAFRKSYDLGHFEELESEFAT